MKFSRVIFLNHEIGVACRMRTEQELAEAFAKEMGTDCQVILDG